MCISNSIYIEEEKVTGGGIQEGVEISSGSEKNKQKSFGWHYVDFHQQHSVHWDSSRCSTGSHCASMVSPAMRHRTIS